MKNYEWCENMDWEVPPPPPNRTFIDCFFAGVETKESKKLHEYYEHLLKQWRFQKKKIRKKIVAELDRLESMTM